MCPIKRPNTWPAKRTVLALGSDGRPKRNCIQQTSRSVLCAVLLFRLILHSYVPRARFSGVQRTQLHNERTVERIVRERSVNGMKPVSVAFARRPDNCHLQPCGLGASTSSRQTMTLRPSVRGLRHKGGNVDYVI